ALWCRRPKATAPSSLSWRSQQPHAASESRNMAKGKIETDGDTATRRGRPRSTETTNAILQSAYTLMAATGLAATSIDAVARHSNVSKMTIYKWWPSREALLIDAFLNHASQ